MSALPSDRYWLKRALANAAKAHNLSERKLVLLRKTYQKAKLTVLSDISKLYASSADDEGKLVAAAVNRLTPEGKLTRKQALLAQIDRELERLAEFETAFLGRTLADVYTESYYRSVFDVQQAVGRGTSFPRLSPVAVERAVSTAWSGANYSDRVWKRKRLLVRKVDEIITQGVTLGRSNDKMTRALAGAMDASYSRASTLVRTETNYVYNEATRKGYAATGLEEYEFLATLDLRTSEECRSLDRKRFKLSDAQAGVNYPPLHPNCRSTTIPVVDDESGTRIARDPDSNKNYEVPANMTYQEWYDQHVVGKYGAEQAAVYEKKIRNAAADRKQLKQYRSIIGRDAPGIADFQQIKYGDPDAWAKMQRQVSTFRNIDKMDGTAAYNDRLRKTYRTFAAQGHEVRIHALNRMNGQRTGKDRVPYKESDILRLMKDPPNFTQGDRLIRYREGIAIVQAADTDEIISVVTRASASTNWKGV